MSGEREGERPQLALIRTLIEYRRVKGTHHRETTDYVADPQTSENRIVPDGAFVLENRETGRRGLFLLEMDMGTERIAAAKGSLDRRATVRLKLEQYDRYLTSGRFASTYAPFGEFRSFTLLFVTYGEARIEHIRATVSDLPSRLHPYYRFTTFPLGVADLLGPVWQSRDARDTLCYALVASAGADA
jgi:hypothetical protein